MPTLLSNPKLEFKPILISIPGGKSSTPIKYRHRTIHPLALSDQEVEQLNITRAKTDYSHRWSITSSGPARDGIVGELSRLDSVNELFIFAGASTDYCPW